MPRKSDAREKMVHAALALMQRRGVGALGLLDVVAAAEAPRGSIYHHFPGGKDQVVIEAIRLAADSAEAAIRGAGERGGTPAEVARRIAAVFRYVPERSQWTTGCPVASTAVEGEHQAEAVRQAVADAFARWAAAAAEALRRAGLEAAAAERAGMALVAALEGGLLLARGLRSAAPYEAAVEAFVAGLEAS